MSTLGRMRTFAVVLVSGLIPNESSWNPSMPSLQLSDKAIHLLVLCMSAWTHMKQAVLAVAEPSSRRVAIVRNGVQLARC